MLGFITNPRATRSSPVLCLLGQSVGFHRGAEVELARIVFWKVGYPIDDKTVKKLWHQRPMPLQPQLELWDYHTHPDRYQARLQVVKLYYQGWEKRSISRFLQVSRPTVNAWIERFEAEHLAGLMDKKPHSIGFRGKALSPS